MTSPASRTARIAALSLAVALLVTSCATNPGGPNLPGDPVVARVEVRPGSFLIPLGGEPVSLTATAYDATGDLLDVDVTWQSSDGTVLEVSEDGVATALAAVGSARVTARAGGVESPPVLGLVAEPVAGVVTIADEQVVGPVTPVDPAAPVAPGWQYRVTVRGVPLAPSTLVIGTGETPIAGRVVSVTSAGDETEALVELVALPELFEAFQIDAEIPMVELETDEADGLPAAAGQPSQRAAIGTAASFDLGRFECETDSSLPELDLPTPTLDVRPSLALRIQYSVASGLRELVVIGSIGAELGYEPKFTATFEGNVTCETVLKTVTLPLGIQSYFFGVHVPLGIGMKLGGKIEIAEVGFDVSGSASATVELGMLCPGGSGACTPVNTFDADSDFSFELIAPDPEEQFKVELSAHGYFFAKPSVGSAWSSSTMAELVHAEAGLKQTLDLATAVRQAGDSEYASSFALTAPLKVGAGSAVTDALSRIGSLLGLDLTLDLDVVDEEPSLDASPSGTFTITPSEVEPGSAEAVGDFATFKVTLDDVDYFGLDSVDKIEFFWRREGTDGDVVLEPARPACTEIAASSGQKEFECQTDFLEEHRGAQSFHAFVHAKLFGAALPIPLEVATDAVATVNVGVPVRVVDSAFSAGARAWAGSSDSTGTSSTDYAAFDWSDSAAKSWTHSCWNGTTWITCHDAADVEGTFAVAPATLPSGGIHMSATGTATGTATGYANGSVYGNAMITFDVTGDNVTFTITGTKLGRDGDCDPTQSECDVATMLLQSDIDTLPTNLIQVGASEPPGAFSYTVQLEPGLHRLYVDTTMHLDSRVQGEEVTKDVTWSFDVTIEREEPAEEPAGSF